MEELLISKLKAAKELKTFTEEIMNLSLKSNYDEVNSMIEDRQQLIEGINIINNRIKDEGVKRKNYFVSNEIKSLNKEIKQVFTEIVESDNIIRKNINNRLKDVKEKLNHPQTSQSVNIKA